MTSSDNLRTDLYQPGNILKKALGDSERKAFVMVCRIQHHKTSNDYFKAVVIHDGSVEYKAGTVVNKAVKSKRWELSSLLEAGNYLDTNKQDESDYWSTIMEELRTQSK